jgi:hypothetical protein
VTTNPWLYSLDDITRWCRRQGKVRYGSKGDIAGVIGACQLDTQNRTSLGFMSTRPGSRWDWDESPLRSGFLIEHDLRATAFGVCRDATPLHTRRVKPEGMLFRLML